MARLTIILPALGSDTQLEETLVSVLQNRPDDSDVLVVHPGNYDDPYELAGEVNFLPMPAGSGLLACLNAAIQGADSDLLHILAPGVEVEEGWTDVALTRFHNRLVAAVAPTCSIGSVSQSTQIQGRTTAWAGAARNCAPGEAALGPAWWASFYRTQAVVDAGGFDNEIGSSLADLDLALTLRRLGYRTESESASRVSLKDIPVIDQPTPWESARAAERFHRRHGADQGWFGAWCGYPMAIASEMLSGVMPIAGRIAGWMEGSEPAQRYEARIAELPKAVAPEMPRIVKYEARGARKATPSASSGQRKAA